MALPFFYTADLAKTIFQLEEGTSKHLIGVLRKKAGDEVYLTDGKGTKALASIISDHRKNCVVQISEIETIARGNNVSIGVSLLKNLTRLEWFMEKATEIGVAQIIPLICDRTEKENFRFQRMEHIIISALLQSQQCWLPVLSKPQLLSDVIKKTEYENKYFAHCMPGEKKPLYSANSGNSIVLIGPEGDFTPSEIDLASKYGYQPVSLGKTRLRTETAAFVAAVILSIT